MYKNDGTKVLTYNWPEIQKDYNENNLTWDDLHTRYGLSNGMIVKASKLKLFVCRTKSEAYKISAIKHPRRHTEETKRKISEIRKKFLKENPDKVPYLLNHKYKRTSYPEQYFTDCFKNTKLTPKYRILAYELDFADIENKIDIEIDGCQHFLDPVIVEHDKKRNQTLIELGWTIYRIRWADFQKETRENKEIIVNSIISLTPIDTKCLLIINSQPNQEKIDRYFLTANTNGYNKCSCGNEKFYSSKGCMECYNKKRITDKLPTKDILEKLFTEMSIHKICKQYNVTRKLIIRYCKILNIQYPKFPKGYWQKRNAGYSHEQSMLPTEEKNPPKRFTNEQVFEIRKLISENKYSLRTIGRKFGVCHKTIKSIRDNITYTDVI
ncbi:MAG: DUF559 domain-containing protein [bacterium]|nr:DUF559 domain-containing protein [bacterium]